MDTKLIDNEKPSKKARIANFFFRLRQKIKPITPYALIILVIATILFMKYDRLFDAKYRELKRNQESSYNYTTKFDNERWRKASAYDVSTKVYRKTDDLNNFETMSQNQLNNISTSLNDRYTKFLIYNRKNNKIITNIDQLLSLMVANVEDKSLEEVLNTHEPGIKGNSLEDKLKALVRMYNNGNENIEICLSSAASPAAQSSVENIKSLKNPQDYLEVFYPTDAGKKYYSDSDPYYDHYSINSDDLSKLSDGRGYSGIAIFICIVIILIGGIGNAFRGLKTCELTLWLIRGKHGAEEFINAKDLAYKYIGFLAISIVAVISSFFALVGGLWIIICLIIPAIYIFYILPKTFKFIINLNNIVEGSEKIVGGDLNYSIEDSKLNGNLYRLANSINALKKGFKVSIDEQVKNERLKSELVANVSHDLKTPLTSIINYTDILMREGLTEEEKQEYLQILNRKSLKLKDLIEALFEVSKINSGKVEIEKEQVNVIELLKQSIGEFTPSAEEKNLKFKLNTFSNEVIMMLDGKKMARVFENLISNAMKYSMENTRVFVEVEEKEQGIRIAFKNISSYDMDFDVNEIFERFSRADKSRTSEIEGNGLGLAIAKSIVEIHGGNMSIEKDGDMFKVFVDLI